MAEEVVSKLDLLNAGMLNTLTPEPISKLDMLSTAPPVKDAPVISKLDALSARPVPQLNVTKKVYAPGILGGIDQFVTETMKAPITAATALNQDVGTLQALAEANGPANALRQWGHEFIAKAGLPVGPEADKSLAEDIQTYRASHRADPKILAQLDHAMSFHMTPDELKELNRGLVNVASIVAPAGKVATFAASPIKNLLVRRIAQAEMHSIASTVAWQVGSNMADEAPIAQGVPQAAVAGALLPPVAKVAGTLAGQGVKYGAKAAGAVTGPALAMADRAASRIGIYVSTKNMLRNFWDWQGRSGESLIRSGGLTGTADQLVAARSSYHTQAGTWHAKVYMQFRGLDQKQRETLAEMLHLNEADAAKLDPSGALMPKAKAVAAVLQEVKDKAVASNMTTINAKGDIARWKPRGDFGMPHEIRDTQQYITPGPIRDEAMTILTEKEHMTVSQAERVLEDMHAHNLGESALEGKGYANLMGRRYSLPGWIRDPAVVLPSYFDDMAQKIEYATRFGGEKLPEKSMVRDLYPKAFEGIDTIVEPHRRKIVEDAIAGQLGQFEKGTAMVQTLQKVAQYQAVMKLGLAQFTQLTQFAATVAQTGYRDSFKDILRMAGRDPELHVRILRTGAALQSVVRASQEGLIGGANQGITNAMNRSGFTLMDTWAREYGAMRGFSMASHQGEELARLLQRQPSAKGLESKYISNQIAKIEKKFEMLGIDAADLVKRGGILNEDDILKAGQKISTDVNFWSDSLSMSNFLKSPWGRVFGQFKSFAFQQTRFLKDYVVKPALDGDLGPLVKTVPAVVLTGEVIADIKSMIRLKPRTDEGLNRILYDLAAGGSLGIIGDGIQATNFSDGLLKWAAGPQVSDVTDIAYGAADIARGKGIRKLGKKVVAVGVPFIPYVGPIIAPAVGNVLFPPKQPAGQ